MSWPCPGAPGTLVLLLSATAACQNGTHLFASLDHRSPGPLSHFSCPGFASIALAPSQGLVRVISSHLASRGPSHGTPVSDTPKETPDSWAWNAIRG